MRWLILTLALTFLTVPGVLVVAVAWKPGNEDELHLPDTDEERKVAGIATGFVQQLVRGRRVATDGAVEVTNVRVRRKESAFVWFTGVSPGPAFRVSLGYVEDEWRVSSYGSFATG
ncbi:hypothetical protein OJ998_34405 [Solirubrobacter taibaiensis]|nr:hypothetical protein [Solirubrobacter taibaiensis]